MNPIAQLIVFVLAAATLVCSLLLMPAAELMPAQVQLPNATAPIAPGLSPVRNEEAMGFFKNIADTIFGTSDLKAVVNSKIDGAPGEVRSYTTYAIFFGLAMIAAAIAINAVGRYDSEEKTVIPVKK